MNPNPERTPGACQPPGNRVYALLSLLAIACLSLVLGLVAFARPVQAQDQPPILVTKRVNVDAASIDDTVLYSITVQNTGRQDSPTLEALDILPAEIELEGDPQANLGEVLYDKETRQLRWRGQLKANESVLIRYRVRPAPLPFFQKCHGVITNSVILNQTTAGVGTVAIGNAAAQFQVMCPDHGDAPDSTNHAGVVMTAYPGPVPARYPTVYDPTTGLPEGPRHLLPRFDAWLGPRVSGERDADLLPDEDLVRNINPPADDPDDDRFDDGVLRWPTIKACTPTDMDVQVTVSAAAPAAPPRSRWVNVWIDWNRDGDWEDTFECPAANDQPVQKVYEWVVQNHLTSLGPGVHTVTTPSFLPPPVPGDSLHARWLRVMLADGPALPNPATNLADGRGVGVGYRFGETEDYLRELEPPGEPKLEMIKQADIATVLPGGVIEYSITLFNSGSAAATGVTVLDNIPAGTTYVPGSLNATAPTTDDSNPAQMKWTGNVPAGGSVTIKFKVQVSGQIDCTGFIRNVAQLFGPNNNLLLEAGAIVQINCPDRPILDIKKSADVTVTQPGGIIEYTVVVANVGTGPATGVTMIDPIPAGTSYVPGSLNATAPTPDDSNPVQMKWMGDIPAGDSVTIKFKVQLGQNYPCDGVIHNRALLINAVGEAGLIAETRTPVECPRPILDIRKSADVVQTTPGGTIEYTVVVVNSGNAPAIGVTVLDPIPSGATYVAGSLNATAPTTDDSNPAQLKWTGDIPAGGSVTIKFKVTVDANFECDQSLPNRALLQDASGQTIKGAEAKVWVGCSDQPIIRITKSANPTSVAPGGIIEYTVVIANVGSAPAVGVTMIDPIPASTTFVAGSETATAPTVAYDTGSNWIKWSGNIPAGGSVTVTFKVTVDERIECGSVIENRAIIVRNNDLTEQPIAVAFTKVDCGEPRLEIKKEADVATVQVGGAIEFTLVVANLGSGPATGVQVLDPVPPGTTYVPGSLVATLPTTDDSNPAQMIWNGNLPAGGSVTIKFKVTVNRNTPCQSTIFNQSRLLGPGASGPSNLVSVVVVCPLNTAYPDFGDAPDSDANHHGLNNTAYPAGPVLGHFPSVWDGTPAGQPSGPHHIQANQYWLGDRVTQEKDADLLPDTDGATNILNNGAGDVADNDKADDGWLNPNAPLDNCRETTLRVRISRALIPPPVERLYLNVWFDGNRDGDWNDIGECPQINARSFEWIVQNWFFNPAVIPAGGFIDVPVGTVLVHNARPDAPVWLRFTLSEQRAVPGAGVGSLPDGRGPDTPNAFRLGETEDYLRPGETGGQPGEIRIEKTAQPTGAVNLGDVITYTVVVKHVGGTAPAFTTMTDQLPAGVVLVGGPTVTELTPNAAPLVAAFNPGGGPNGIVTWSGALSPGAEVQIQFRVRVRECTQVVRNVAVAVNTNGATVEAKTENSVNCEQREPGIELRKRVRVQNTGDELTDADLLPGDTAVYYLNLSATDGLSHTVHISDDLPSGLIASAVSASSGVANIVNGGQGVVWDGVVNAANQPVVIKILVRQVRAFDCERQLVNIARWFAEGHSGQSNPVTLVNICRDLGDAPDSTNHAGAAMTAYPGTPANYPTIFRVAAPERGPRHERPRPFHLGRGVTFEVEADLGFDADGVNNIEPTPNRADLDKRDDGLLLSTVSLRHCQFSTMRVLVNIDPAAIALLPNGIGYLNLWVDGNRDGDWADQAQCDATTGTANAVALEHIVIDQPVNAAALGAGVQVVNVVTSVPALWPDELAQRPVWLRVTLSERPSNKPFSIGALQYGDGRGHDDPFRLGETEDYLLPGGTGGGVDPTVRKQGRIHADVDPATGQRRWVITWVINYVNLGGAAATDVHVIDTFAPPQTLVSENSIPSVPHTQVGNTLDYNVGTLPAGGAGVIIIRTAVPFDTAPDTMLTNGVVVQSSNDDNEFNNESDAAVRVPLLPPIIIDPLNGTTCSATVTVRGHAQVGTTVDLYVDNALAVNLPVDANGEWSTTLTLANGSHDLYAVARLGSQSSTPSPTVTIKVDDTLFWDPISLRFTNSNGHVILPSGRLDESGWSIFLRPGQTYTVSLRVCCSDPNAQVTVQMGDISLTLSDPEGDRIFTATFTVPTAGRFTGTVRICVTCNLIRRCSDGQVTIDPEGTVFDLLSGLPIDNANVACLQAGVSAASAEATFNLWPAADFDQINPQTVATDGYFSFFTPQGTYRLNVAKPGYQPYSSPDLTVVDAPVHFDVPLTPVINEAASQQIVISESGFEPAVVTVAPGAVVEWINTGADVHTSTTITPSVSFDPGASAASSAGGSTGWDSGLLQTGESYKRQLTTAGVYTYRDEANPANTATIIVAEPVDQPKLIYLPLVDR